MPEATAALALILAIAAAGNAVVTRHDEITGRTPPSSGVRSAGAVAMPLHLPHAAPAGAHETLAIESR
jgi:hypothetical protein